MPFSAEWRRETGDAADGVIRHLRACDLLVARPEAANGRSRAVLQAALFETGRPLFVPATSWPSAPFETIAIAWKETREAAGAVAAAMPFLMRAKRILVLPVA